LVSRKVSREYTPLIVSEGCGEGRLEINLAKGIWYSKIVGIDASSAGIKNARNLAKKDGVNNVSFEMGRIEDYYDKLRNRTLTFAINSYQYFRDEHGRNGKVLEMLKKAVESTRIGSYILLTGPSLEDFGKALFGEFVEDTEFLPRYTIRDGSGRVMHQEALFGNKFLQSANEVLGDSADITNHGKLPFNAKDLLPIACLAENMGRVDVAVSLREKALEYKRVQEKNPSEGPMVEWYIFQRQ